MKYLLVIDYERDTERKRIDYLIEKWSQRASIEKIKKMAILVEAENIDELIREITSRLEGDPDEKLRVYQVKELKKSVPLKRTTLKYSISNKEGIEGFLNYLMAKLGASYQCSIGGIKNYQLYTKKGKCSISVGLYRDLVTFEIEGYSEGVDIIKNKIHRDMKLFIEGSL
ncbi:MAG TPA: hypothetical protein EYH15_00025 [Methanothermococcus okinawensis]|uniref:Uncharacterized protein n=1 Tax=Methanothermococcus okinawensis TaxID=155863 RepID=A0A832ZBK0_9EURY|nr:hypothetical protein [Methanococcaceae archaeon]HIP83874.1 hypothetical protein [Methanothermococcus okinawensis]HIP91334.1 hypothetical protein [Methanothermococcus okinawensis]